MDLLTHQAALASITLVRTALVLVFLTVVLRLAGKRYSGDLNLMDLMMVLMVANACQSSMTFGSASLAVGIASGFILLALPRLADQIGIPAPILHRRLLGAPRVLAYAGTPILKNLEHENVSISDLLTEARKSGLESLEDVKLAILEPNGAISIIPNG